MDLGFIFLEVFLRQLGKEIRSLLAHSNYIEGTTIESLRALALEADRYFESSGAHVNAIVDESEAIPFSQGPSAPTDTDEAEDPEQGIFAISCRGAKSALGAEAAGKVPKLPRHCATITPNSVHKPDNIHHLAISRRQPKHVFLSKIQVTEAVAARETPNPAVGRAHQRFRTNKQHNHQYHKCPRNPTSTCT